MRGCRGSQEITERSGAERRSGERLGRGMEEKEERG